jgi:ankyrin repeat protein
VEEAYEKILGRVSQKQKQKDNVKKILQIVVGAHRALTIQEMAIALGIATSAQPKSLDQVKVDPSRLEANIRDWCGLFIFINHARIYLIHQTAKEFLIGNSCSTPPPGWKHCLDPGELEKEMTRICVEFLCLEDTRLVGESMARSLKEEGRVKYRLKLEECNDVESLWVYSAVYWTRHLRDADTPMNGNISQLYNTDGSLYDSWFTVFWDSTNWWDEQPKGMNSIHLAAFLGHGKVLRSILQSNGQYEIDKPDECGRTALIWASDFGHEKVVQILLNAGADVNAQAQGVRDGNSNALYEASAGGHEKVVQILVDRGADVNAQGARYGTALSIASAGSNEKIVQMLLDRGADINALGDYGTALSLASALGNEKVIQILVDRGADVNAQGGRYGTALSAAMMLGNEKIVQILLNRGADVNCQGGFYGNALCEALARGYEKIVQILVDRGADVNAFSGGYCGNALYAASKGGHVKIVQILVDRGADVNAVGKSGTALSVASALDNEEVVQILVDAGADVNAPTDRVYGSPLYEASARGKEKIVQMLLDRGADVNALGDHGTALDVASKAGHEKIMQILLDAGADVNPQGGNNAAATVTS